MQSQKEMASEILSFEQERVQAANKKPPVTLKFEDIVHKIKIRKGRGSCCKEAGVSEERQVLKGITGVVLPCELLAILGPSGSGKTTLLNALGGRLNELTSGNITYNGKPFSKSVKQNIGFVPQNDFFYPHLSVTETLVFTALLRLPNNLSKAEKVLLARQVINQLDLSHCKNTIMGGPFWRGVSGGERKRVSIGQELLTNPSPLLVDEPTSGLDSTTAKRIVFTLCELAKGGRTVVMTIHQPSSKLFYMFHKVLLLSEGSSLYFGKGECVMNYFSSIGYVPSVAMNPSDFLLDLANGIFSGNPDEDRKATKQALVLAYENNLAHQVKMELRNSGDQFHESSENENLCQWNTTWLQQFSVLLRRAFKDRKHELFSILKIIHILAVSVLASLFWWQSAVDHIHDQLGLLFYFCQFCGFFPLVQAIFTFSRDYGMLVKEKSSRMYRLSSYFMAISVVDIPMQLVLPSVFVTMTYWMGGLKPNALVFLQTLAIVLLYVMVSQGLGLAIGALVKNQKAAATVAAVVMTSFVLVNGFFVQNMPGFVSWVKHLSLSYHSFKLLVSTQFEADETYNCDSNVTCFVGDFPAIKLAGFDKTGYSVAALATMLIFYRLVAYFALVSGLKHK